MDKPLIDPSKILDPAESAAAKVIAITTSGVTGIASAVIGGYTMQEWTIIIGLIGACLGALYGLLNVIMISPRVWGSILWWFGRERRRPNFIPDDEDQPRRRLSDPEEGRP